MSAGSSSEEVETTVLPVAAALTLAGKWLATAQAALEVAAAPKAPRA
jgi:hypothetical protein